MEGLTPGERMEVDAAVHDAYVADDGTIRSHAEAAEVFDHLLIDATQAHRRWAGMLMDAWRYAGMKQYIRNRWKELEGRFDFSHKGRTRSRTMRRGTRVRDSETGREWWIQDDLFDFTASRLERAIAECTRRIEEERANIALYRALLDLLEVTGCATVRAALGKTGQTLEEYLAGKPAA